jgi:acyl transferase domain-containing protein
VNGERNTVISGEASAIAAIVRSLADEGIESQPLATSHAFHSPLMEPLLDAFDAAASKVSHGPPAIPLICGLSGAFWPEKSGPDARYWRRHFREPIQFLPCIRTLAGGGRRVFLEIGPGSTLIRMGQRCGPADDTAWLPSLLPERVDGETLLSSLGALYTEGAAVDWRNVHEGATPRPVSLPTYPFQRQRYWCRPVGPIATATPPPAVIPHQSVGKNPPATPAESIIETLRALLAKLMHSNPAVVDIESSFLELGADSLVLVDATRQVEETFGVKIGVRQLFEELPTPKALARHIAAHASAPAATGPVASPLPPAPLTLAAEPDGLPGLAAVMQQQLRIIEQQLEILRAHQTAPLPVMPSTTQAPSSRRPVPLPVAELPPPVPPTPQSVRMLTPGQQHYLDQLAANCPERTPASRERAV